MAKRTKASSQRAHTIKRLEERFNIEINNNDYNELCFICRRGQGKFISRQSQRVTRWLVNFKKQEFIAVYDKTRGTVVTVLPKEYLGKEYVF